MSQEFRWGILGTGGIARAFARDLTFLNNHIVAAVGSRSTERVHKSLPLNFQVALPMVLTKNWFLIPT